MITSKFHHKVNRNEMPKGQRDRKKQGIATGKREATRIKRAPTYKRQRGRRTDPDNNKLLDLLKPSEADVMKLLAAQTHIGRRKCHVNMRRYTWKRRQDGVHIINLEKTWAKIILAARILVTVKDPSDIAVMSTRTIGQRGAIKFAHYTGATAMVGKWVPGTFTNPRNKRAFTEPRVIIVDEPTTCFGALRETSYVGIPVIGFLGTDNNTKFVDCAIPCNNRGKYSIGLMFWLLTRELLRMRGKSEYECVRSVPWKESVDLFFYRDADEIKRQQDAKQRKADKAARAAQQAQYGAMAAAAAAAEDMTGYDNQMGDDMMDDQVQGGYDDMQQPVDNAQYGMDQGGYEMQQDQHDWEMPQGQEIEDWDQQDDQGYGAPQQAMDDQQQAPPQQQYEQQAYDQQAYGDQDNAAMGYQNW